MTVDVAGDIQGDVYASGQHITVSGDVTGDIIAAAQTIVITGTVDGNVRIAAQDVTVDGDVTRSGTIFAATLNVTDAGSFGGDLVGGAGDIAIAGEVGRDVVVGVGTLTIDGSVGGDVTYDSDVEANIAEGAVEGSVEQIVTPQREEVEASPLALFAGWLLGLLYALVAFSLITALTALLLPRLLRQVTEQLVPSPWKALLVGFVASITVPVVLLFLLVTVIGAPLALAVLLVWIAFTLATFVFGAYYIGRLLFRGTQHPVVPALVGGAILIVGLQIPWLNIAVWLAMVLFGLGAELLAIYAHRPWRRTPPDSAAAPRPAAATPTVG
ncbi:polymer-forming cytoskeletal protein [Salinibacterium sp. dk5596]|uniref:polymer-forming cytoskeletal protein n=1 Tax=Salinibacterium sp. dk5596 TaxID=2603291 RepID=UPI002103BE91|nr:polymer-forming cytoskeletal protein [Salinibacterium sp. dk5596]